MNVRILTLDAKKAKRMIFSEDKVNKTSFFKHIKRYKHHINLTKA